MRRISFLDGVHELDPEDGETSIRFWKANHFLDGIKDPVLAEKCALSYTRMAQYVFGPEEPCTVTAIPGFELEVSSLPLVRRVVCGTGLTLKEPACFIEFCKDYLRDKSDHYEKVIAMHRVDLEAQVVCDLADYAVRSLKKAEEKEQE